MIEKDSRIPLHYQVKDHISKQIEKGVYRTGDKLPPEFDLAESLGVSRNTVRQAILSLVNEGRLFRDRGRGTFVAEQPLHRNVPVLTGFHEYVLGLRQKPSSQVKLIEVIKSTAHIRHVLNVKGKEEIVHIHRLVGIDNKRVGIHEIYLPHSIWRKINASIDELKNKSLYSLLITNCDVDLKNGDETIYVREANPQEAAELSLPAKGVVLVVSRLVHDQYGKPVCYADNIYNPDKFKYYIKYKRPENLSS